MSELTIEIKQTDSQGKEISKSKSSWNFDSVLDANLANISLHDAVSATVKAWADFKAQISTSP